MPTSSITSRLPDGLAFILSIIVLAVCMQVVYCLSFPLLNYYTFVTLSELP